MVLNEGAVGPDLTPIVTALTGSVTVTQIIGIIATIVGATVAFVLAWAMAKKLYRAFVSGITGHASL
jgi:uncharacterized membrane protein